MLFKKGLTMTKSDAFKKAARLSKDWANGAYVVQCAYEREFLVVSHSTYNNSFCESEFVALFEGGERVDFFID